MLIYGAKIVKFGGDYIKVAMINNTFYLLVLYVEEKKQIPTLLEKDFSQYQDFHIINQERINKSANLD